jgi:hypothetical protein
MTDVDDDDEEGGEDDPLQTLVSFCTPEQRLRGRSPAEILAALAPEERLALLDSPAVLAALPDAALAALPDAVLGKLSPASREIARARAGR